MNKNNTSREAWRENIARHMNSKNIPYAYADVCSDEKTATLLASLDPLKREAVDDFFQQTRAELLGQFASGCNVCGNTVVCPMLRDGIWNQISPRQKLESDTDLLCLPCAENALGRELVAADLAHHYLVLAYTSQMRTQWDRSRYPFR